MLWLYQWVEEMVLFYWIPFSAMEMRAISWNVLVHSPRPLQLVKIQGMQESFAIKGHVRVTYISLPWYNSNIIPIPCAIMIQLILQMLWHLLLATQPFLWAGTSPPSSILLLLTIGYIYYIRLFTSYIVNLHLYTCRVECQDNSTSVNTNSRIVDNSTLSLTLNFLSPYTSYRCCVEAFYTDIFENSAACSHATTMEGGEDV